MKPSAQDAYVTHHASAVKLTMQVTEALFNMPAPDSGAPIHWGHVGSVQEVEAQLRGILGFITTTER